VSLKVLLADDNLTAQRMGSKILTDAGYEVVAVSNGAAAIKKIASEKPQILILDVFMPGYTGLEVCEKIKNDPATAKLPVILTVTNMEPFEQKEGDRVRADGLMIKPFEASDLVAVVQKFEAKSAKSAAASAAPYAETQKIEEFKDASYEEWKTEATDEAEPKKIEMSAEVASAPALGFDEPVSEPAPAAAFAIDAPVAEAAPFEAAPPAFGLEESAASAFEPLAGLELTPSTDPLPSLDAAAGIAPPAEFEATSAAQVGDIAVTQAAELEVQSPAGDVVIAQDPALVTNADEMAQFTTVMGEENPEEVVVGIAMPGLTASDEAPTAEFSAAEEPALPEQSSVQEAVSDFLPPPAPDLGYIHTMKIPAFQDPGAVAEAAPAPSASGAREQRSTAEMDMQHAIATGSFGAAAAAPALAVETDATAAAEEAAIPEPPPEHPNATPPPIPDHLVAEFAAELEQVHQEREARGEAEPETHADEGPVTESIMAAAADIPASQLDEERIASAVTRALEKYKDGLRAELIATIIRELKG
jgi:CheY-like chemotaxis protein